MKLNFKKKLYIVFIIAQLFLILLLVYSSKLSFDKLKNNLMEKRIVDFKNSFTYEINQQERELFIIAESIKYNNEFLKILNNIINKTNIQESELYNRIKDKFMINILEIGDKEGTVLYRFHRPDDKGDSKSNQKIIKEALNGNGNSMIEYGHSGLALRYATPFISDTTLLIGKKLNSLFLKSLQRGEIKSIFLMENQKFTEFSDINLFKELEKYLPTKKKEDITANYFYNSNQTTYFNHKDTEYLCLILNYSINVNDTYQVFSFYILYDDTHIVTKQNKLISDIVIVSIVVLIFSIVISYIQFNNEAMKLERTESYLELVQKKLVESEKIGALGKLVSGFAHKINSPLSAIIAGISNLEFNNKYLYNNLFDSIKNLSDSQLEIIKNELDKLIILNLSRREERELKGSIRNFISSNYPNYFTYIPDIDYKFIFIGISEEHRIINLIEIFNPEDLSNTLNILEYFMKTKKNIDNLSKAANNSTNFIRKLKFFSENDLYGSKTKIKILDLLNEELVHFKHLFDSRISIELDVSPDIYILCYPNEIKRVFHELIHNSILAIPYTGEISIICKTRNSEIDLIIRDNGIGIPNEINQKLFDPFVSSREEGEGIGLGLYISKKIIELHNGSIFYFSQDHYTLFQIILPV